MSNYGADHAPDLSQAFLLSVGFALQPGLSPKVDQYSYAADDRSFHLVDKHSKSSLWIRVDPTCLPPAP